MADASQYLALILDGAEYLLPGGASVAIEQRHALIAENGSGPVIAWRETRQGRWPAYGVNASMRPGRPANWQRAVFLNTGGLPLGLAVEEVHLLGRSEVHVSRFTPLGPPPTRAGHFFSGARVDGHKVTFVFEPRSLVEFLRSLGGAA